MELTAQLAAMEQAFAENKFSDLLTQAKDFIEANPSRIEGFLYASKACWGQKNAEDAEYYLVRAKGIDEKNVEVLANLGMVNLESGDIATASYNYDLILENDAKNVIGLVGKADCEFATGAMVYAIDGYVNALNGGAKDQLPLNEYLIVLAKAVQAYYQNEQYAESYALLQKHAPSEFSEPITVLKRNVCRSLGDEKKADYEACVSLLHEQVPNNPNYILELAQIAAIAGDKQTVGKLYTKLLKLESLTAMQKAEAHAGRAAVWEEIGKFPEAVADYDQVLALDPSWYYYEKRALAKTQLKDYKGALEDITKALSMQSTPSAATMLNRGRIFMQAFAGSNNAAFVDRAIADFNQSIKMNPGERDAYYELGMAYNKKGDMNESFKALVDAEVHGHIKAREMLLSKFSKQLVALREKASAGFLAEFQPLFDRNKQSPILQQTFGKLWLPDMQRILISMGDELTRYSKDMVLQIVESMAAEMLIITPEAMLYFEDANAEPLEFFYKVVVESQHAILLEAQPTKGGDRFQVKVAFFEGALLFTYPVQETEAQPSYFLGASAADAKQKARLTTKKVEGAKYQPALEASIAELTK